MSGLEVDVNRLPTVAAAVATLVSGFSPRLDGQDEANVELLAGLHEPLPPILVHRPTNQVIDGMHRLLAARRRGLETINVRYYDGDEASAFVLAVRANVTHGLPLPLRDRKVAAARILGSHAFWSNRRIAQATGLSDKTVAGIRAGLGSDGSAVSRLRVGLDERTYSLDSVSRRAVVTRLLSEDPAASLRTIAGRAGVSPQTVRAVKRDLGGAGVARDTSTGRTGTRSAKPDPHWCLRALAKDPALRSTDAGRRLLRIVAGLLVLENEADRLVDAVPEHGLAHFERVAHAHAEAWRRLADLAAQHASRGFADGEGTRTAA